MDVFVLRRPPPEEVRRRCSLTSGRMLRADKRNSSTESHLGAVTSVGLPTGTWQTQGSFINERFHLGMDGYLIKAAAAGLPVSVNLTPPISSAPLRPHAAVGQEGADGQKSRWESADNAPLFSGHVSISATITVGFSITVSSFLFYRGNCGTEALCGSPQPFFSLPFPR